MMAAACGYGGQIRALLLTNIATLSGGFSDPGVHQCVPRAATKRCGLEGNRGALTQ